ncbi:hypothetical protein BJP40_11210 [Streptomyces sp. CC53]|uniref:hypothetical protein n=1 Tax=Streptomyces sp. CC53 TaxID=1906740 RepID=UPI0008DDE8DF|nr:hypothetical protein [Streptomyces sp. CC53]OII60191.1 hypothetical protein BJP40_11210 [Streptomyces sp. CC53]
MANTRKHDQAIRTAQAKLKGVQARETWALPAREQAAMARHAAVLFGKALKLKDAPRAEKAIETIWANAAQTLQAEISATEAEKARVIAEEAKAKAERKSKGWW